MTGFKVVRAHSPFRGVAQPAKKALTMRKPNNSQRGF
jgi:hypothetical protein